MMATRHKNQWFVLRYTPWFAWLQLHAVLQALSERDDLQRLVLWARRKKLSEVRRYYQYLLSETENRLLKSAFRHRQLTALAKWIYCAQVMLFPARRFYPKGSGAKYRLRN